MKIIKSRGFLVGAFVAGIPVWGLLLYVYISSSSIYYQPKFNSPLEVPYGIATIPTSILSSVTTGGYDNNQVFFNGSSIFISGGSFIGGSASESAPTGFGIICNVLLWAFLGGFVGMIIGKMIPVSLKEITKPIK